MDPIHAPTGADVLELAQIIQLSVAPVFLLAGIGAFLNVCAGRLSRIVDRARAIEPLIRGSRGAERDRLIAELRELDKRMGLVSRAIFMSVLSAVLVCTVIVLLFTANLLGVQFATVLALLFIASMIAIGAGFAIFLVETRLGSRSVRIPAELFEQPADE
jgi:MFS family permease